MLGHASAAMTLDVHAGLFTDDLAAVAERLDARPLSFVRTVCGLRTSLSEARTKKASQGADLRRHMWAPSGSNRRPTD
jgi:hypothetical protein